jgi:hypothetical protein
MKLTELLGWGNSNFEVQKTKSGQENVLGAIVFRMETERDAKDRRNVEENKMKGG